MQSPTASMLIIGNEILSGRTQDKNLAYLAGALGKAGIVLREVRVIPDDAAVIRETVKACSAAFDYVFTTGGIGPTHDDITSECIAEAFGRSFGPNAQAVAILEEYYAPDQRNAARMSMADMPEGASLIPNPVSAAPGFMVENVIVMAGVPRIAQAMVDWIVPRLQGGAAQHSRTISAYTTEGVIAEGLTEIQERYDDVAIGSYPFIRDGRLGVSFVARGTDEARLDACAKELRTLLERHSTEVSEGEPE